MILSEHLKILLGANSKETFSEALMASFTEEAKERNPDVTSEKMLTQLARPKYNEAIKKLNEELESLKIINRRIEK